MVMQYMMGATQLRLVQDNNISVAAARQSEKTRTPVLYGMKQVLLGGTREQA